MDLFTQRFSVQLKKNGILPIVCLNSAKELETFIQALLLTSIRCIEITMRNPFSYEAIGYIKNNYPDFTVGAGTVVNSEILNEVVKIGVDFCVSPGFDVEIIKEAFDKNIAFLPGCATPSEILRAQKCGMHTVKLFPAECSGGINALKLYQGAFSDMSFLPTGGINLENVTDYVACDNVIACGGSFMIPKKMLAENDIGGINCTINNCIANISEVLK